MDACVQVLIPTVRKRPVAYAFEVWLSLRVALGLSLRPISVLHTALKPCCEFGGLLDDLQALLEVSHLPFIVNALCQAYAWG